MVTISFSFTLGSTISHLKYASTTGTCIGEYTKENYSIGASSTGGVKYRIVPGTASLVPSLAPTAFSSTLTSELSGYTVTAEYSDDECNILKSAVSYPLNSCIEYTTKYGVSGYAKYAATAYTIARTEYSDSLCKTAMSALGPTYIDYTASCVDVSNTWISATLAIVNANGVPPSSITMASIRLVHTMSLSCVMGSVHHACFHFDLYFDFLFF